MLCSSAFAQVGIGTTSPNASAALDVSATNRGLLMPRYTTTDIANIVSPAKGLMVYDSTKKGFYVYSGQPAGWIAVGDNLGTPNATQNLKINGNYISNDGTNNGLSINTAGKVTMPSAALSNGGITLDFLKKDNTTGDVGFRKGHGGFGIKFIIATAGLYPINANGGPGNSTYSGQILGEIRMWSGFNVPDGFMLCEGQLLTVNSYPALYSLLGTTYGSTNFNNFRLPDMRGVAPVGTGAATSGNSWTQGEKTD